MEDDPFPGLQVDSFDILESIDSRGQCPKCDKSRKYFCYNCFVPVAGLEVPNVKLPLQVDIIKHPNEIDGKSTSAHAAVLAPDYVQVYTYPEIPHYKDPSKVVLVYPCQASTTLADFVKELQQVSSPQTASCSKPDTTDKAASPARHQLSGNNVTGPLDNNATETGPPCRKRSVCEENQGTTSKKQRLVCSFDTVIFIDSTWNQAYKIFSDERLQNIRRIELQSYDTKFWRHQTNKPQHYLATVEAVYHFLREYHKLFGETEYAGQYDNLLFFFCFMYKKIKGLYEGGKHLKAYQNK